MRYIVTASAFFCLFIFSEEIISANHALPVYTSMDTVPAGNKKMSKKEKKFIASFPAYITTDSGRASFVVDFFKGKALYEQTCSTCHDSTKDGKLYYPDFLLRQLLNYEMRFLIPQHQESLRETNISTQELAMVLNFLRYKKTNLKVGRK